MKLTQRDIQYVIKESIRILNEDVEITNTDDLTPEEQEELSRIMSEGDYEWEYEIDFWDGGYAEAYGWASVETDLGIYHFTSNGIYERGNGYQPDNIDFESFERFDRYDEYEDEYEDGDIEGNNEPAGLDNVNEISIQKLGTIVNDTNAESDAAKFVDILEGGMKFTIPGLIEYLERLSDQYNYKGMYEKTPEDSLPEELQHEVSDAAVMLRNLHDKVLAFAKKRSDKASDIHDAYHQKDIEHYDEITKKWKQAGLPTKEDYFHRERPDWNAVPQEQIDKFTETLTPDELYSFEH